MRGHAVLGCHLAWGLGTHIARRPQRALIEQSIDLHHEDPVAKFQRVRLQEIVRELGNSPMIQPIIVSRIFSISLN